VTIIDKQTLNIIVLKEGKFETYAPKVWKLLTNQEVPGDVAKKSFRIKGNKTLHVPMTTFAVGG